jgi:hypothetical protein
MSTYESGIGVLFNGLKGVQRRLPKCFMPCNVTCIFVERQISAEQGGIIGRANGEKTPLECGVHSHSLEFVPLIML